MKEFRSGPRPVALAEDAIAAQLIGLEIEFDDKVTLFPVQVAKDERPLRRVVRELRNPIARELRHPGVRR